MMRAVIGLSVCLLATSGYADEHWLQARLQQLSRQRDGGDNKPVVIDIPDGVYRLEKTLKLSPDVIGDGLTLRAENSGKAILSGGRLLPQGERDERGLWRVPLPTDSNRFGRPRFLMIDGRLRPAARHPNTGYHRIEETLPDRRSGFVAATGDVPNGIDDGFDLILLHDWSSSRLPVQSYDDRTRTLRTVGPIGCEADHYAIDHFEKQPRYWLEGHSAFADVEGEWYIDADSHELVIVGGENQKESPTVVLPWLSELLVASGTDKNPIGDLTIQGVVFTESRFEMPPGGYAGAQASMHEARDERGARMSSGRAFVQAAVKIEEASGCRVTNCDFRSLGGSGLWIGGRTRDCIISRSRFAEIGGNGLNLGEDNSRRVDGRTWYMAAPDQVPTGNKVERCEFSHCGQILPGAVAVWGALHRKLEITGNHIHDCPYTGISLGWLWNDRKSPAAGNIIRDNRIEFVMQVLSDGGGIYTLGRQPDTLITGNRISDIPLNAGRAESNGLFLDQGTTGLTISGNTIRRVEKSPVRFHQCGKNIVRENRWELATDETPPVRFNRTPKENIAVAANEVLEPQRSYFLIGNS
ncbi:MAG: right-handed parallel beta-helix repeat-containing protein, partial [Planctomycetota bacterium]